MFQTDKLINISLCKSNLKLSTLVDEQPKKGVENLPRIYTYIQRQAVYGTSGKDGIF